MVLNLFLFYQVVRPGYLLVYCILVYSRIKCLKILFNMSVGQSWSIPVNRPSLTRFLVELVRLLSGGATSCSLVVNLLCVSCRFAVSFGDCRPMTFVTNIFANCDAAGNFAKWIVDHGGLVSRNTLTYLLTQESRPKPRPRLEI